MRQSLPLSLRLAGLATMLLALLLAPQAAKAQPTVVLEGEITANRTLHADTVYLLRRFVYVKNNATLTIEPGTVIKGEKATKGTLIITTEGTIMAEGTPERPIVFTSAVPEGNRNYGDWGGVIILGKAPINCVGGTCAIEGGVDNANGDGRYGGTDPDHSSGVLRYVQINFPGVAFQPDNEINGLTMGGVGRGTVVDHIQVSYSGDDAFEWFGGTVNAKYLVSLNGWDDDFDTDFGYAGNVQFGLILRQNASQADQSFSNAFESDNSKNGAAFQPFTSATFSNITVLGPGVYNSTINPQYQAALHLRNNTQISVFNSVFAGYPIGLYLDGESVQTHADTGALVFSNNVIADCDSTKQGRTYQGPALIDVDSFFDATNTALATTASLQLVNATAAIGQAVDARPATGSPLLNGAAFADARLQDTFFTPTTYVGAFDEGDDWTAQWVSWDPLNTTPSTVVSRQDGHPNHATTPTLLPLGNPVRGNVLHLSLTGSWQPGHRLHVQDAQGRLLARHTLTAADLAAAQLHLPTTGWPNGVLVVTSPDVPAPAQRLLMAR